MSDKRVQYREIQGSLSTAIFRLNDAKFEEAVEEAKRARKETHMPDEQAYALFVEAEAHRELCLKEASEQDCRDAKTLFQGVATAVPKLVESGGFVDKYIAANRAEEYKLDLAGIKDLSLKFGAEAQAILDNAKKLQKVSPSTVKHKPNNLRLDPLHIKFDKALTNAMQFTPQLSGVNYIRQNIFGSYDSSRNEWISKPGNFKPYTKRVESTHHYKGPAEWQDMGRFSLFGKKLIVLNIPDGFTLDSGSIKLDDKSEGFEVVQDEDGVVYVHSDGRLFLAPIVEFDLSWDGGEPRVRPPDEETGDLIPGENLPDDLAGHIAQTQLYGATEKYEAVRGYIIESLKYPEMRDILSGKANFPEDNGREFYTALANLNLPADCDVSNAFAVILLRKMGVPARLVTGFYIDHRGVGRHGWLEYWDAHEGEWMRGDVTPPFDEKGRSEPSSNLSIFDKPYKDTNLKLIAEKVHAEKPVSSQKTIELNPELIGAELEKIDAAELGDYLASSPEDYDRTFAFNTGYTIKLSEPNGRYLGNFTWGEMVQIYDLERNEQFFVHFPERFKYQGFGIQKVFETDTEPIIVLERKWGRAYDGTTLFPLKGDNMRLVINKNGEVLFHGMVDPNKERLHFSKFLPHVRDIKLQDDIGTFVFESAFEDESGILHLLIREIQADDTSRIFYHSVNLRQNSNAEIALSLADLGAHSTTMSTYTGQSATTPAYSLVSSPSGLYWAVRASESNPYLDNEVTVFKGPNELYKIPYIPYPHYYYEVLKRPAREVPDAFNPELRVNDDGSIDIKQAQPYHGAFVIHINPDGTEDENRSISWSMEENNEFERRYVFRYKTGNESRQAVSLNFYGEKDIKFSDITFDGSWIKIKIGAGSNYSIILRKNDPDFRPSLGFYRLDNCTTTNGKFRCLERQVEGIALIDPINIAIQFGGILSEFTIFNDNGNNAEINLHSAMEERKQSTLWEVTTTGAKKTAFINTFESPENYFLEKLITTNNPSMSKLRVVLDSAAVKPNTQVFHDWILVGAARLFSAYNGCRFSTENSFCNKEISQNQKFLRKDGAALAKRLLSDIEDTLRYPNQEIVEKGFSYLIAGALKSGDPSLASRLIGKMVATNSHTAAEAIIIGFESRLIDLAKLPELNLANTISLQSEFSFILEERRRRILGSGESLVVGFGALHWLEYQDIEDAIARRFGLAAIPPPTSRDW